MNRVEHRKARIGIFGIGLAAYWPQFDGLREKLAGFQATIEERMRGFGCEIVSAGMVAAAFKAQAAGDMFCEKNVALIFCYTATYATSSQVLLAVQRPNRPVVVLNIQSVPAIDYENVDTGGWLANCSACCVPEISCAFSRACIRFNVVSGMLENDDRMWTEIREWIEAASVLRNLQYGRTGFLGHTYPGMLDMYSDFTQHHAQLGTHIEILEMCDLCQRCQEVTDDEIGKKLAQVQDMFEISEDSPSDPMAKRPTEVELNHSCRVACALDKLVEDFALDAMTYYYRGVDGNEYEQILAGAIMGNTMLTARGIPCAGEGDLKTCMAMYIMECLDAGGSYTEFYAMDFNDNFVLMGHDGPAHAAISDSRPILRALGLYHGKRGRGVSVEMKVKTGPITILGMTQTADGRLKFVAAEGESIPGPIMRIGNTNSRLQFSLDPATFMTRWCEFGPTHHVALGVDHQLSRIRKLARLLDFELNVIE